jgi:cytochrome c biogenesis protein CcmG, thiol:disulfide interchange protein DsbE
MRGRAVRPEPPGPSDLLLARVLTRIRGVLLASLLPLALVACDFDAQAASGIGAPAPTYEAPTMDGEMVSLDDFRGQVLLLNMWATWCPPCRWEMPHLQSLHEELGDRGLAVVGVSVDAASAERQVRQFLDELGIDFLILRDPQERGHRLFGGYGLPMTVVIDGEGVLRWRHMGPVTSDDPELRAVLDETLGALVSD